MGDTHTRVYNPYPKGEVNTLSTYRWHPHPMSDLHTLWVLLDALYDYSLCVCGLPMVLPYVPTGVYRIQ